MRRRMRRVIAASRSSQLHPPVCRAERGVPSSPGGRSVARSPRSAGALLRAMVLLSNSDSQTGFVPR